MAMDARPGGRAGRPVRRDPHRARQHLAGHGGDVPGRAGRGLRGLRDRHAAADAGRQARPRHRQRPHPGRLPHRQPARRAGARRGDLRGRHGAAVHDPDRLRRPRRRPGLPHRYAAGRGARARRDPRPPGHRRGRALAGRQQAGAHPRPGDRGLQHHLGRPVVGAGAVVAGAGRDGRGRLRPAHHRVGARRAAGDGGVRAGREAGPAGHPDAHRAGVRGGLPPRDGADDLAVGGVPADVLLRRLRLHLGDAVAGGAAAGGAHGVPGPRRLGLHAVRHGRHARSARCWAG